MEKLKALRGYYGLEKNEPAAGRQCHGLLGFVDKRGAIQYQSKADAC
jgi:hypothetical protein